MASCPVPIGEVFAGKYRVEGVLGEGGMGVVMSAHHLELDQRVAVKFLLDDLSGNEEGAERFRREARAAAKIQSDHVVRVIDVGILDTGERYMVMECLEGRDLAEEIAEKKKFSVGVASGFILEAIDAVAHAHAVGIIHRDLKPANLFLTRRQDGGQRIKVLDFGISKAIGAATTPELSLTKTSAWIGSPLYMAPEQMESARDVDERADIWSLGAILYELVTGRTPYQADSLPHLCNLLITQDPDPIKEVFPEIPTALAEAIMGCLTRDPLTRTQHVLDFGRAISPFATSITGSSMRASLFSFPSQVEPPTRTEPLGSSGSFPSEDITFSDLEKPSTSNPTIRSRQEESGEGTHAAWGGTGSGVKKGGKPPARTGILLVALLGVLTVGFFVARGAGRSSVNKALVGVSDRVEGAVQDDAQKSATATVTAVEDDFALERDEDGIVEGSEPNSPVGTTKETAPMDAAELAKTPTVVEAPRPRPRPRPRPPSRPSAEPKESPKSDPVPAEKDDFADFGGRR